MTFNVENLFDNKDDEGNLVNAGALVADESVEAHSRQMLGLPPRDMDEENICVLSDDRAKLPTLS